MTVQLKDFKIMGRPKSRPTKAGFTKKEGRKYSCGGKIKRK